MARCWWRRWRVASPDTSAFDWSQLVRYVGEPYAMVDLLVVEPESWRQGVGGVLLHSAEAWGMERGAALVRLETYIDGPVSVPFYEKRMGYQRRALIFEKRL
jgi:GNAT superfamily N-acetyltransferase